MSQISRKLLNALGIAEEPREKEYIERLIDLEKNIRESRLVSKEAQMSALSGKGYVDPRFISTTGNELIDQFGLSPFMPEGAGQILTSEQLGMEGPNIMVDPNYPGQYYNKEPFENFPSDSDKIFYKTDPSYGLLDLDPKQIQKHEITHRAAYKSGYADYYYDSDYLKENADTDLFTGRIGEKLKPLIQEALAHSYEQKDKKLLKKRVRNRAKIFGYQDSKGLADEIVDNIDVLQKDFENYLKTKMPNPSDTNTNNVTVKIGN